MGRLASVIGEFVLMIDFECSTNDQVALLRDRHKLAIQTLTGLVDMNSDLTSLISELVGNFDKSVLDVKSLVVQTRWQSSSGLENVRTRSKR
jgi:hypothetical protein